MANGLLVLPDIFMYHGGEKSSYHGMIWSFQGMIRSFHAMIRLFQAVLLLQNTLREGYRFVCRPSLIYIPSLVLRSSFVHPP